MNSQQKDLRSQWNDLSFGWKIALIISMSVLGALWLWVAINMR